MEESRRIAFNTIVLYFKMIITSVISLLSTRIVLNELGVVDFGIFNLIAGVVTMLTFLNAAMGVSTQRFLSFYKGKDDIETQKRVFINSVYLHVLIGLLIVFALQLGGLFLFDGILKIPSDKIGAAKVVYHFMSITVFFSIVSVPFTASSNAHENMIWLSLADIIESILRMGIALYLVLVSDSEKLIVYGSLTAIVSVIILCLHVIFCTKNYPECKLNPKGYINGGLVKELGVFAGWNLFGALAGMGRSQGLAVLLNLFFGTVVNAAYGIANQVSNQLGTFTATLLRAINPQIMKSEGASNREKMMRLSMIASKFGFFLLAFIVIPCIFEMPSILKFWLKKVPDHSVIFCILILTSNLLNQLTIGLQSAAQAIGKVKMYQSILGLVLIANLPIAYCLLAAGFPAYIVLVSFVVIQFIVSMLRIFFLKMLAQLSVREYFRKVFLMELIPVLSSVIVCYLITITIEMEYRFVITIVVSVLVFIISIYYTGVDKEERELLNGLIINIKQKLNRK